MCKLSPGARCAKHTKEGLDRAQRKLDKTEATIAVAEQQYASAKAGSKSEARLARKLDSLEAKREELLDARESAQLDYDATPRGQEALKEAQSAPEPEVRDEAAERLLVAQARREWQRRVMRQLREMEQSDGIPGAILYAQQEMRSAELHMASIKDELLQKQAEVIDAQPRVKGRRRPSRRRIHTAIVMAKKATRLVNRQRLLYALVTGDLEKYIDRKIKQVPQQAATFAIKKVLA